MSRLDSGGPYKRPSLLPWVTVLRLTSPEHEWVRPTDEEDDIAAVLEAAHETHRSEAETPDNNEWLSPWGLCVSCGDVWPCPEWLRADSLGRLWSGRMADRYAARANAAWQRLLFKRRSVA